MQLLADVLMTKANIEVLAHRPLMLYPPTKYNLSGCSQLLVA